MRSYGGGEKDLIGWTKKLTDHELTIFSPKEDRSARLSYSKVTEDLPENVRIFYYNAIRIYLLRDIFPISSSGGSALISLRKYNSVYSMHQGIIFNLMLLIFCKFFGVRFIIGIHSPIFFDDIPIENSSSKRFLMKFFVKARKLLLSHIGDARVQNSSDSNKLRMNGFRGRIYDIPPHVFDGRKVKDVANNEFEFIALFVGRLAIRHKGLDILGDVIDSVMKQTDAIKFHIVGSGIEGENFVKELTLQYPDNVKWKGFLAEEDLVEQYRTSSIFLFPSRGENFGISLAEAQVNGLPAVAFKVMGSKDIIIDPIQGVLVTPFNVDDFASAILNYFKQWHSSRNEFLKTKNEISTKVRDRFSDMRIYRSMESMLMNADS